jgi:spore maturation protein CgeB
MCSALGRSLAGKSFDLCHVDNGECVSPSVIALLRRHCGAVVNYNIDDPFGRRDSRRFSAYRSAVPHYDLVVVIREINVAEAQQYGARRVLCVHRSADELTHAPRELTPADHAAWSSHVLFVGTWMPERGPMLAELIRLGVPLTIRGSNWRSAPEWAKLAPAVKSAGIFGDDYAKAIQCAQLNLGLLSKGNRDLHTTRSLEIPALGGLLLAERTEEHLAMYRDGVEAVFWNTPEECAQQCRVLMADETRRRSIAAAGHRRVVANGHFNEPILSKLLATLRTAELKVLA